MPRWVHKAGEGPSPAGHFVDLGHSLSFLHVLRLERMALLSLAKSRQQLRCVRSEGEE